MTDLLAPYRKTPPSAADNTKPPKGADEYVAFDAKDKLDRLDIRRANDPTRSPGYAYLLDVVYDGSYGTNFVLVYTFLIVLVTGNRQYLFPNQHNPISFMSENTMLYALYRMGYHSRTTGHGFRSTASTILNEHGFMPDVIERQLAHCERNKVRAAYNHAQYLPERRKMMQWWANYLDGVTPKTKRRD
jgi:integrase